MSFVVRCGGGERGKADVNFGGNKVRNGRVLYRTAGYGMVDFVGLIVAICVPQLMDRIRIMGCTVLWAGQKWEFSRKVLNKFGKDQT